MNKRAWFSHVKYQNPKTHVVTFFQFIFSDDAGFANLHLHTDFASEDTEAASESRG